jgi:hypothetical protein
VGAGANVNAKDDLWYTPLYCAVEVITRQTEEIALNLIAIGRTGDKEPDGSDRTCDAKELGRTLWNTQSDPDIDCGEFSMCEIDTVEAVNGRTPLIQSILNADDAQLYYYKRQVFYALIMAKADINATDQNGVSPLYCVTSNNESVDAEKKRLVSILVKNQADVNRTSNTGDNVVAPVQRHVFHLMITDVYFWFVETFIKCPIVYIVGLRWLCGRQNPWYRFWNCLFKCCLNQKFIMGFASNDTVTHLLENGALVDTDVNPNLRPKMKGAMSNAMIASLSKPGGYYHERNRMLCWNLFFLIVSAGATFGLWCSPEIALRSP